MRKNLHRAAWAMMTVTAGAAALGGSLQGDLRMPAPSHLLLDRHGDHLGEVSSAGDALGYWELPHDLPSRLELATLHTEDQHYFDHAGVYLPSVARAAWQNLTSLRVISGASTVAMQVARMQTPASRNVFHKLREALEALLLVHRHGHLRVLRHYLTLAPYGNRVHGAARAARMYFDKPVEDLSWLQAAFLAGLPQSPGRFNPYSARGLDLAMARARQVLQTLQARGVISPAEHQDARSSALRLVPKPVRPKEATHAVLALGSKVGPHDANIVHTTLDLEIQRKVARIVKDNLRAQRGLGAVNSAALVVEAHTGEVLAYVGSARYFNEEEHGAVDYVQARRSPGSALKPFIYGLAMDEKRWSAATLVADVPVEFQSEAGQAYLPQNFSHNHLGPMLVRTALGNSRNIPALRALSAVGVERMLRWLQDGGVKGISFDPYAYGLGLALGNLHVTMEELVGLYMILANDGRATPLVYLNGPPQPPGKALLSAGAAQMVIHILGDAAARRPTFAAGGPMDEEEWAMALKTGTSQGSRDAWAVALSDRLLVALWVGRPDGHRMNHLTGANACAAAVNRVMHAGMPLREPFKLALSAFLPPQGYEEHAVCSLTGQLAGPHCPHARVEWFAPGTAPWTACAAHLSMTLDVRNRLLAGPGCPQEFTTRAVVVDLPAEYGAWARAQHLELAPTRYSAHCPAAQEAPRASVAITQPLGHVRLLRDPDTPKEYSTLKLSAQVDPPEEDVVWLLDGSPVGMVGWPHEIRLQLEPGIHTITAALAHQPVVSAPVMVTVDN